MTPAHLVRTLAVAATLCWSPAWAGYTVTAVSNPATVSGAVKYAGTAPKPGQLTITKDEDFCGKKSVYDESLLVSSGGGLANVIVYLDGVTAGKALSTPDAELSNTDCHYIPHVQALAVGTVLHVTNDDPILHNTHGRLPQSDVFNYALPRQGQDIPRKLTRAGLMKVGCDAGHTWMSAYIAVFGHPYYAVTDSNGQFTISDVPPGTYKVIYWHEKLGGKTGSVTVSGGTAAADLTYPAQ